MKTKKVHCIFVKGAVEDAQLTIGDNRVPLFFLKKVEANRFVKSVVGDNLAIKSMNIPVEDLSYARDYKRNLK
jgi:hypothetical protein